MTATEGIGDDRAERCRYSRKSSWRWLAAISVSLVALGASLPSATTASKTKPPKTPFVTHFTHVDLSMSAGFPSTVGSTLTTVGPLVAERSWPKGKTTVSHGLAIRYLTVTEVHPPDTWVMEGTGDNFYPTGMHHVSFQLTSVLNPADRTVSFTGAGEILPGPGKFRGATGRFTFAGTRPAVGAGAITETITGWIRTPHLSRPKS